MLGSSLGILTSTDGRAPQLRVKEAEHMRYMIALTAAIMIAVVGGGLAFADGLDKAPPTRGVERFTAHTLRASELQLGVLFSQAYQDIYAEVGISDSLQLGLSLLTTISGQPHGWVNTANQINDDLIMGAELGLRYRPGRSWPYRPDYLYGQTGFVFSMMGQEDFSLHAGLQVRFRVNLDAPRFDYAHYSPYAVVDTEVADGFVLLGEAAYNPTYIRIGMLMRVWDVLDLKVSIGLPDLSGQFGADLRISLGGEDVARQVAP